MLPQPFCFSERFGGESVEAMGCGASAPVLKAEGAGKLMAANSSGVTPTNTTKRQVRTTVVMDLDLELTSGSIKPAKPGPKRTTAVVDWQPEISQADIATPL